MVWLKVGGIFRSRSRLHQQEGIERQTPCYTAWRMQRSSSSRRGQSLRTVLPRQSLLGLRAFYWSRVKEPSTRAACRTFSLDYYRPILQPRLRDPPTEQGPRTPSLSKDPGPLLGTRTKDSLTEQGLRTPFWKKDQGPGQRPNLVKHKPGQRPKDPFLEQGPKTLT